jgi:hypothetical protein
MINETKKQIELLLGVELQESYCSVDDDNPDEEFGHFKCFNFIPNPVPGIEDYAEPPIISIYEGGKVQLFHDATPYPCAANTQNETRQMMQALIPFPISIDQFTQEDYDNFINTLKDNF